MGHEKFELRIDMEIQIHDMKGKALLLPPRIVSADYHLKNIISSFLKIHEKQGNFRGARLVRIKRPRRNSQ